MQIKVIGSGSSGNCYLMYNETECLIIELGFSFKVIKQSLNYDLSKVVGAIISHEHGDHSKGVRDALLSGIDCYMSQGTAQVLNYTHHRLKIVEHGKVTQVGGFAIMPFDVKHDCAQPFGFLIYHKEAGTTCFITDSFYCEFKFEGLNNIIVEANFCDNIIRQKVAAGNLHNFLKDRVIKSHMSIDTCKQFLAANNLDNVINILLVHLSDSNSDAARFKAEIEQQTAKIVNVASKGLLIDWNLQPF